MDGDEEFRFISFNIPNLNYVEDDMTFTRINPYDLPNEFEMRDAFETIKEMGGQAIRIYTIPVRNTNFPAEAPTHVEAPGKFNEEAFKANDMMLALANEYQIRIIFSLLNNWQWMGGAPNYAEFRGKEFEDFWKDKELIRDFKNTIKFTLNRVNTITGVPYNEDKAIMCWETGNELECPHSWTAEITKYIKKLDKNHLILDGFFAIDNRPIREESITDPNVDIVSSHHYEQSPFDMIDHIEMNRKIVKGRKPYLVGEFGFVGTKGIESVLEKVIDSPDICGALIWSLRYRHRNGGFYWHSEPLGGDIYKAFHWPGFQSGERYDERNLMSMYRKKAFTIQDILVPGISVPKKPVMLPAESAYAISWQGSMGAEKYEIERSETRQGPWEVIAAVDDATNPYFPLFHDKDAAIGSRYYYRTKAVNSAGSSAPSNIIGPLQVTHQAFIDDMVNYGNVYSSKDIKPVKGNDRSFKEILHRMEAGNGSEMTYMVPGDLHEFRIFNFEKDASNNLCEILGSSDGKSWEKINMNVSKFGSDETNYEYWTPKIYSQSGKADIHYLKITFSGDSQLARVEIIYN